MNAACRHHRDGLAANDAGQIQKARDFFMQALRLCPNHAPFILSAANMQVKLKEPKLALGLLQRLSTLQLTDEQSAMAKRKISECRALLQGTASQEIQVSTPRDAAAAAELYKDAKNLDLSPVLRKSKLARAISLWDCCAESPTISANLGKAHHLFAGIIEPGRLDESMERTSHLAQSVRSFSAACNAGRTDLLDICWECFTLLMEDLSDRSLTEKLHAESCALSLPVSLRAKGMGQVAQSVHNLGIKAMSGGDWDLALRALHQAGQQLTRVQEAATKDEDAEDVHHLAELQESITLHLLINEGRQAVCIGDLLINEALRESDDGEAMMDSIWNALDKYSEAGLLGRDRDIETEAIAVARRGKIYAKVFRNESLARPLLTHALELATSLAPRTFYGVPWHDECKDQLQSYQQANFDADSRAAERRRQEEAQSLAPVKEKMKAELDALNKFANSNNVYKLLEHVYSKYPPKVDSFVRKREHVLKAVKDATADTIKKVLMQSSQLHYHPDKNVVRIYGAEWHVLSTEISKLLNGKYNQLKDLD